MSYEGDPRGEARRALLVDAAASGLMGVMLVAFGAVLAGPLALPVGLMRGAGLFLLPYAAALALAARGATSPRALGVVITCNVGWVLASVALLVSDRIAPTTLGTVFVLAQAAAVTVFAILQLGARRALRVRLVAAELRSAV